MGPMGIPNIDSSLVYMRPVRKQLLSYVFEYLNMKQISRTLSLYIVNNALELGHW